MQFEDAKRILNKNGKKYTDEEVKAITKLLREFVKLDVEQFNAMQENGKGNIIH